MSAETLLVEAAGPVLRVTLNRPEKRNALSRDLLEALRVAFVEHADDAGLRVAVLRGAGDKSFAAGGDLRDLASVRSREEAAAMAEQAKAALDAIRYFPLPVVAALNGDALGGGAELALACDFRVAAASARLGFLQGRINITTAWGGGVDLLRTVGRGPGLGLLCSGEMVGGERALALGVMDRVATEDEGLEAALEDFMAPLLRQAPQVLRGFKRLSAGVLQGLPREELDRLETALFSETWVHRDHWDAAEKILSKESRA